MGWEALGSHLCSPQLVAGWLGHMAASQQTPRQGWEGAPCLEPHASPEASLVPLEAALDLSMEKAAGRSQAPSCSPGTMLQAGGTGLLLPALSNGPSTAHGPQPLATTHPGSDSPCVSGFSPWRCVKAWVGKGTPSTVPASLTPGKEGLQGTWGAQGAEAGTLEQRYWGRRLE